MREPPGRGELKRLVRELGTRSTLGEAARIQLCFQAREIDADIPAALTTRRLAPLHDARVAGRRLRAGALLFQCLYTGVWASVAERARQVTRGLRQARDLDIRCNYLRRLIRRFKGPDAALRTPLARLLDETVSERTSPGVRAWGDALGPDPMAAFIPALWSPTCPEALETERFVEVRLREMAQAASCLIPVASIEGLAGIQHRLRIRVKSLRYSLEMMEWRLRKEAAWRIKVLQGAQDVLGEMHDIDIFLEFIQGKKAGCARSEKGCYREVDELLAGVRHQDFMRFLELRGALVSACAPLSSHRPARSTA